MPTVGDIYYFESKNGDSAKPAVVLIHGAGGTHLHWPHNIRRMSGFRVYALDLPGHGKSGGLGEQSVEGYCDVIVKWMTDIGLSKAVFVGHSMGGAIALTMALEHQDYALGLGLVSTGARLSVNPGLIDRLSTEKTFSKAVDLIVKWSHSKDADPKLIKQVHEFYMSNRPAVLHGDFLACDSYNVKYDVKKIKTPVMIICGENDIMTPPRYSEYLEENISGSKRVMIPGSGHMALLEQPEKVAKVLEDWLAGL